MKLLGWMHSKFRHSNGDAFKDLSTVSACNCLSGIISKEEQQFSPTVRSPMGEQHMSNNNALLFEGLLSIGTLGSSMHENEMKEYPEYEYEYEYEMKRELTAIAEREEEEMASETELMVVNKELEKVLTEAAEVEEDRMSSARPSHFTGKANEACPLQEFLFAGATTTAVDVMEKEKKKKRASLVELFMIEKGSEMGSEMKKEMKGEDGGRKGKRIAKKMMKRNGDGGGAGKDGSVKTAKFNKILQLFHKKIHPDNDTTTAKKHAKSSKHKSKCATTNGGNNCLVKESLMISSNVFCNCNRCSFLSVDDSESTDSSEHWINTDADFLVLEIQKGITSAAD